MMMSVKISDWVMATTNEDELIHGFVQSMDSRHGVARIYVIASDHDSAIGKVMEVAQQDMKKLPVATFDIEDQVKSLIDIALTTRDELWFMELTDTLFTLQQNGSNRSEREFMPTGYTNRLGVDQF
ncbi:hypothetical protein [Paenibacillus marchantiophytorum]|nr:hypothetical protein [Paenibacillus marchantiophytorum]